MAHFSEQDRRDLRELKTRMPLQGEGAPEGSVMAPPGRIYVDKVDGHVYVKKQGLGTTGWADKPDEAVVSGGGSSLTAEDIGLDKVDNTSDNEKPISVATQAALDGKADDSHTHTAGELSDTTVTGAQLNELVAGSDTTLHTHAGGGTGDVVGPASATHDNLVGFSGTTGKLIKDSGLTLSGMIAMVSKLAGIEAGATADQTTTDLGLENVDNTADVDKPVSTAQQTALDGKSATGHGHTASDVSDFTTAVSSNAAVAANTAKDTNATHTGDVTGSTALTIANGAVDLGHLSATGTKDSTTFLRGDNTFAAPPGGSSSKKYAEFYMDTGGRTGLAGTEVILVLNQTGESTGTGDFTLASNQVTVKNAGTYLVIPSVYLNNSATTRTEWTMYLKKNGTKVANTDFASYQRGYDDGMTSGRAMILSLAADDYLEIACIRTDGSGTAGYQNDNGTSLVLLEL